MSQVAGRLSIQAGATALEKINGGRGILLGGVPGVMPGTVVVVGGGVVGFNAAQMAVGLGADVTIVDNNPEQLERLGDHFESRAKTRFSNHAILAELVAQADLVIGAVLIPGAAAPKLVTREMLAPMKPGSVLVDVAIDQGGCFETSRPTNHDHPTFVLDGIVHYCVSNMPGAVARTSTYALNNATLPRALKIAELGWKEAMRADPYLATGLNVHAGRVTHPAVARELGYELQPVEEVLAG
jgi:alanine dehydrogenase